MNGYSFPVSAAETHIALDCEAERAEREGFKGVAERQRAVALHIRNAEAHMVKHCPEGYRVQTSIAFEFVPDVRPTVRDDVREARS